MIDARSDEQRVMQSNMRSDPRLARAALAVGVSLLGFRTLQAFYFFVSEIPSEAFLDARAGMLVSWQRAAAIGSPDPEWPKWMERARNANVMDSPMGTLLGVLARAVSSDGSESRWPDISETTARWRAPLKWYPYGAKTTEEWTRAADAVRRLAREVVPYLPDFVSERQHTDVRYVGLCRAGASTSFDKVQTEDVAAFRQVTQDAERSGVNLADFRVFLAGLVLTGGLRTVRQRARAFGVAQRVYGSVERAAPPTNVKLLGAYEDLPAHLGRDKWTQWVRGVAADLSDVAKKRLAAGSESEALELLDLIADTPIEQGLGASGQLLAELSRFLRHLCFDIPAYPGDAASLHSTIRNSLPSTVAALVPADSSVRAYLAAAETGSWADATRALFAAMGDEAARGVFAGAVDETLVGIVRASKLPADLRLDAERLYKESSGCNQKRSIIKRCKIVESYGDGKPSDRTALLVDFRDRFVENLRKKLGASRDATTRGMHVRAVHDRFDAELKRFEKLPRPSGASLDEYFSFVKKVMYSIDRISVVRVVLTMRTFFGSPDVDRMALESARSVLPLKAASDTEWCGVLEQLTMPALPDGRRELAGPFYSLMLNGVGIKDTVTSCVMDVIETVAAVVNSPPQRREDVPHYIFSAYGLSGTGKTRTLLSGDKDTSYRSVLQTIIDGLDPDDLQTRGIRIHVGVMDVYGEIRDRGRELGTGRAEKDCIKRSGENARSFPELVPRSHCVTYDWPALLLHESARGLEEGWSHRTHATSVPVQHGFIDDVPIKTLPAGIQALTTAKKSYSFGDPDCPTPAMHVRRTPNNPESSRAHTAVALRILDVRDEAAPVDIARITLLDMAGAEDVDTIQNEYFETRHVRSWRLIGAKSASATTGLDVREKLQALLLCETPAETGRLLNRGFDLLDDKNKVRKLVTGVFEDAMGECRFEETPSDQSQLHVPRLESWVELYEDNDFMRELVADVFRCPPMGPQIARLRISWLVLCQATHAIAEFRRRYRSCRVHAVLSALCELKKGKSDHQPFLRQVSPSFESRMIYVTDDQRVLTLYKHTLNFVFVSGNESLTRNRRIFVKDRLAEMLASKPVNPSSRVGRAIQELKTFCAVDRERIDKERPPQTPSRGFSVQQPQRETEGLPKRPYLVFRWGTGSVSVSQYEQGLDRGELIQRFVDMAIVLCLILSTNEHSKDGIVFRQKDKAGKWIINMDPLNKMVEKSSFVAESLVDASWRATFDPLLALPSKPTKPGEKYQQFPDDDALPFVRSATARMGERVDNQLLRLIRGNITQMDDIKSALGPRTDECLREVKTFPQDARVRLESSGWLRTLLSPLPDPAILVEEEEGGQPERYDTLSCDMAKLQAVDKDLSLTMDAAKTQKDEYCVALEAMKNVHFPLRYQGLYIKQTIAELQEFVKNLASNGSQPAESPFEPAPWITSMLGLHESGSGHPLSHNLKFVQFVAVRTDFNMAGDEKLDTPIKRDQRKGFLDSVEFARRLNPLDPMSRTARAPVSDTPMPKWDDNTTSLVAQPLNRDRTPSPTPTARGKTTPAASPAKNSKASSPKPVSASRSATKPAGVKRT